MLDSTLQGMLLSYQVLSHGDCQKGFGARAEVNPVRVLGFYVPIPSIHLVHELPGWNIKWLNHIFLQFSMFTVHGSNPDNGLVSCPNCPCTNHRVYDSTSLTFWSPLKILLSFKAISHSMLAKAYCCGYEIHTPHWLEDWLCFRDMNPGPRTI